MFEFDAGAGDIVEFSFRYKKYSDDSPLYEDLIISARYKVEMVTTNTHKLKTFTTRILEEDRLKDSGKDILPWEYIYTEKIGYYYEFIPIFDNLPHPAVDNFAMLRCYSEPGFSYVSDEWLSYSLPCDFTTDIKTFKNEFNKIYPNPFSNNLFVVAGGDGVIEITDILGKVVLSSKLSNGENEILTEYLLPGMYFAKVTNKDNSIHIYKIVKI